MPYETDANGNPLPDLWTNAAPVAYVSIHDACAGATGHLEDRLQVSRNNVRIPVHVHRQRPSSTDVRSHLGHSSTVRNTSRYDVAAWSDLWFYSNPIFIEVSGSAQIASLD